MRRLRELRAFTRTHDTFSLACAHPQITPPRSLLKGGGRCVSPVDRISTGRSGKCAGRGERFAHRWDAGSARAGDAR
jgi:hypothetical protein